MPLVVDAGVADVVSDVNDAHSYWCDVLKPTQQLLVLPAFALLFSTSRFNAIRFNKNSQC